jgi:uncharacterized protein
VSRALVIVGKAPRAGSTKTRLVPPLTPSQAAELYRAFLRDTAALGLSLGWERVSLIYPGETDAGETLRQVLPEQVELVPQVGKGLRAALTDGFQRHFHLGFDRVVLIGSDAPNLPRGHIQRAEAELAHADVVIGRSADGGWHLLGLTRPHPGLFEDISWSTERVYAETLQRAAELNLNVRSVDEWYDVDTTADLERLRLDLATQPTSVAAATRAALAALNYAGGGTTTAGVRPDWSP